MKSYHLFFLLPMILLSCTNHKSTQSEKGKSFDGYGPAEYLWERWTYPNQSFNTARFDEVLHEMNVQFSSSRIAEANWRVEGPLNIGGRINSIAINPEDQNELMIGASSGGVFKTTDGAETWESVGDEFASMAIGSIAYDPQNPEIIYVGTGDPNISSTPKTGSGVYRSNDGGESWEMIGLEETGIISKVLVHPTDSDILYVASMGTPYYEDENRGVYRSVDGGQSWEKILFLSPQAGVSSLVFHPDYPEIIFAGGWNRIRNNQASITAGEQGRVYRTQDRGDNWEELSNGLPDGDLVRAALDVSISEPGVVYASFNRPSDYEIHGVYRSDDFGDSWTSLNVSGLAGTQGGFGWYFGRIIVNPQDADEISVCGVELHSSTNGGNSWFQSTPDWWTYEVHADMHDLAYAPDGSIWLATDGGLYKGSSTFNNWQYKSYLPISQFYRITVNPHQSGVYAGGMQDNGTSAGNFENAYNWPRIFGGDGFQCLYDWNNPSIFYAMTQNGNIVQNTGFGFDDFTNGIGSERVAWDAPLMMSSFNSNVLYTGTTMVYKINQSFSSSWQAISDELTGPPTYYPANRHVITVIAESPLNQAVLYAGTSDGFVWVSQNGGSSWTNITTGLPDRYVTDIVASDSEEGRVFVTHSGYKDGDNTPLVHVSDSFGSDWYSISENMPAIGVNHIEVMPQRNDEVVFIGTDAGIYFTEDFGENWLKAGDMPNLLIFDLAIDYDNNRLIAGTFARSIQSVSLDSLLTGPTNLSEKFTDAAHFSIYPNPASTVIHLKSEAKLTGSNWAILDANGKTVKTGILTSSSITINDLSNGMYWLRIENTKPVAFVKAD